MGGIVGDYACLLGNKIKPAGQLVSGSKESGITPITGFDAKLIDLFDYAKSAQSQYRGAIIYSR